VPESWLFSGWIQLNKSQVSKIDVDLQVAFHHDMGIVKMSEMCGEKCF
jgi:hypothetical protein